jgi:KamA family protein
VGKEEDTIADVKSVVDYIKEHPEITNVLLSGGDSFLMSTKKIDEWLNALTQLEQLDFIRFGTRTPVTFPQRILNDPALIDVLSKYSLKKQIYAVTHFNHPNEFTPTSKEAVKALQSAGVVIKNQTVLMRGINDSPDVLAEVLRKVSSWGIIQHYIFQCRPVLGVKSKFQVPLSEGLFITQLANAEQNGFGKSADYTMSHPTGKIRILGRETGNRLIFQYKQAKDPDLIGSIFIKDVGNSAWLEDDLNLDLP